MLHRYYIGFQLPDDLRKEIERAQQELFDSTFMRVPLEPHITMLPPPAVENIDPEVLKHEIRAASEPFWPLRATLSHIESFKQVDVAIHVDSRPIHELQKRLVMLLSADAPMTYFPNPTFTPHVTLAQAERSTSLPPKLLQAYRTKLAQILPATFETTHLTLFKWIAPREYLADEI